MSTTAAQSSMQMLGDPRPRTPARELADPDSRVDQAGCTGKPGLTRISLVIPCYNDEESLVQVLSELEARLRTLPGLTWELLVVDDGSERDVGKVIGDRPGVRVLRHAVNRGYGAALKTGIRAAKGDFILTFDADGQHDSDSLPALLEDAGAYDMVIGSRESLPDVPAVRRLGKWFLTGLLGLMLGRPVRDMNSGLRLMRRSVIMRYLHLCSNRFSFSMSSTMAFIADDRLICFVPVRCRSRTRGTSSVRLGAGLDALVRMLRLGVVFCPLRVFLSIALAATIPFAISLAYDLYCLDIHDMTVLLGLFTVVIFCFGLLADQIAHLRREIPIDKLARDGH